MWLLLLVFLYASPACAEYSGELSLNPYAPDSTANPFGAGSPFTNQSAANPFATEAPRLYDQEGHYRGKLAGASKGDSSPVGG
jgi:hypothetical protein